MAIIRYVFKFENTASNTQNYQIVDADIQNGTGTGAQQLAQMCAYFASAAYVSAGGQMKLVEVTARTTGSPGAIPQTFPTAAYAATLAAGVTDGVSLAGMATGFATQISAAGALCPLGTSISVTEKSNTVGRTGRGRHFLPFIGVNTVATDGTVKSTVRDQIRDYYNYCFLAVKPGAGGAATAPIINLQPCVTNRFGLIANTIVEVKPQPVFSNLESRRR